MIKLIYTIDFESKEYELDWLRLQKVYPAIKDVYNWKTGKKLVKIGAIVGKDTALSIKLRHNLDLQTDWHKR